MGTWGGTHTRLRKRKMPPSPGHPRDHQHASVPIKLTIFQQEEQSGEMWERTAQEHKPLQGHLHGNLPEVSKYIGIKTKCISSHILIEAKVFVSAVYLTSTLGVLEPFKTWPRPFTLGLDCPWRHVKQGREILAAPSKTPAPWKSS